MTDSVNELTSVLPLTLQWVCCYSCGKVAGLVSQARAAPCKRAAEDVVGLAHLLLGKSQYPVWGSLRAPSTKWSALFSFSRWSSPPSYTS